MMTKEEKNFAELLIDYKEFKDRNIAMKVAQLATELIPESESIEKNIVSGKKLVEVISERLNSKETKVINLYYGITDGKRKDLEEVGKYLGLTTQGISGIRYRSLRKLRQPRSLIEFYIPYQDGQTIEKAGFSTRTYRCLRKAGYRYLEDLENVSAKELMKIRSMGKKSTEEVLTWVEKNKNIL